MRSKRAQYWATVVLVGLGPVLAVVTSLLLSAEGASGSRWLRQILLVDFVYILIVAGVIARSVIIVIAARRRRSAGSSLHLRLATVFAAIALTPTVLVAVFAVISVNFGLESWFSERVRNVVANSLAAAQAYEAEHRENLAADTAFLAEFLNQQKTRFPLIAPSQLRELLNRGQLQMQRELPEAFIIDGSGALRARGDRSYLFDYEEPSVEQLASAAAGETVIVEDWDNNEFRALLRLDAFVDRFLYVTREVDGEILQLLDETRETVGLYQQVERDRGQLLFDFALVYLGFALIVILGAMWVALGFAERLSRPVGRLAGAAQRVGDGDLDVRVREERGDDEIATLGRVFNTMTAQLKTQRDALLTANRHTESRRRLFDSILTGVTSGVIGLDADGRVEMVNRAAGQLLSLEDAAGRALDEAVPEFGPMYGKLLGSRSGARQGEVRLTRSGSEEVLLVRMARRSGEDGQLEGYVVTFDDVSDLVQAQRMAAWGDVARRIAHEIKNPLTPIQLSAERLRRKFRPLVPEEDAAALEQYSDVIIRQTGDLRRIVDEFSRFARMPASERRPADPLRVLRDAVHLQEQGADGIRFRLTLPETSVSAVIDETMIGQALTNLLKNATEAIDARRAEEPEHEGEIRVVAALLEGALEITIQDDGIGLPENRKRLFEPYVTLRDKGTGLGLSIVKKIVDEHAGRLELRDAPPFAPGAKRGAEARMLLPVGETALQAAS
ncbi:MAG: PAS domain-containing sensor histidine kinase [Pseudomonadota bacterium]